METNNQPVPHVSPELYASVCATANAILHKTSVDIIQQLGRLVDDTPPPGEGGLGDEDRHR